MIVYNCSHPLTDEQKAQLERLLEDTVEERLIRVQLDLQKPFAAQLQDVVRKLCADKSEICADPAIPWPSGGACGKRSWVVWGVSHHRSVGTSREHAARNLGH